MDSHAQQLAELVFETYHSEERGDLAKLDQHVEVAVRTSLAAYAYRLAALLHLVLPQ